MLSKKKYIYRGEDAIEIQVAVDDVKKKTLGKTLCAAAGFWGNNLEKIATLATAMTYKTPPDLGGILV